MLYIDTGVLFIQGYTASTRPISYNTHKLVYRSDPRKIITPKIIIETKITRERSGFDWPGIKRTYGTLAKIIDLIGGIGDGNRTFSFLLLMRVA
jgi:hypothetical protein